MHSFPLKDMFPGNFVREFVSWNQMSQILVPLMRLHHFHLSCSKYKQDSAERQVRRIWRWQLFGSFVFYLFVGPVEYSHIMSATCQVFQAKNAQFLEWFKSSGGGLHDAVGIAHFEDTGRGAIALEDIAVRSDYSSG